jgi:hypothetical protein
LLLILEKKKEKFLMSKAAGFMASQLIWYFLSEAFSLGYNIILKKLMEYFEDVFNTT